MPVLSDDLGPFGNPSSDAAGRGSSPASAGWPPSCTPLTGAEGLVPWMQAFEEALRTHCGVSSVTQQRIETQKTPPGAHGQRRGSGGCLLVV